MRVSEFLLRVVLAGVATSCAAAELTPQQRQTMVDAAQLTQTTCYKNMYRDTNVYTQCVRDLAKPEKKASYKRLGIEYFGYVGGLSYMRVSQLGAEQAAAEFLNNYRATQKLLGVSDEAVCSTVPGDCTVRMAQTQAMEAAPPKAPQMRVQCMAGVCKITPIEPGQN